MFRKLFEDSTLLDVPVVTMLFFFGVFVTVLIWVLRRSRSAHFDRMSKLPLDDRSPSEFVRDASRREPTKQTDGSTES